MISVQDIGITQGKFNRQGLSFEIPTGRYAALTGRTGVGKTSLLEVICGLRTPSCGRVLLDGVDITSLPPAAREIGYVPQDLALFGTMTVSQNVAFGPRMLRWPREQIASRVEEMLQWIGIAHLKERHPANLSGGEAQRVALARALATRPRVLLLDEPLGALDARTRHEMILVLKHVRSISPVTVLHVTHNLDEAKRVADAFLEMNDEGIGQVSQEGSYCP